MANDAEPPQFAPERFADLMVGPWHMYEDDRPKAAVLVETGVFGTLFLRQARRDDADWIALGHRVTFAWAPDDEEALAAAE